MRWPVLLLFLLSGGLAAERPPAPPPILTGPPWRTRREPTREDSRLGWGAEDAEAERVGKEAVAVALADAADRLKRLVFGVGSTVNGVAGKMLTEMEGAREVLEGVAKGVQETVSDIAHDAGEVLESVVKAANPTIFPGTNWCGSGDRASQDNETGIFKTADRCCREHDSCPESIAAGEIKHGMKNDGSFTLSLCECDQKFHRCLKESNSIIAKNIGFMFFNVLKMKCFAQDYPPTCGKDSQAPHCKESNTKATDSKIWHFHDNPTF